MHTSGSQKGSAPNNWSHLTEAWTCPEAIVFYDVYCFAESGCFSEKFPQTCGSMSPGVAPPEIYHCLPGVFRDISGHHDDTLQHGAQTTAPHRPFDRDIVSDK